MHKLLPLLLLLWLGCNNAPPTTPETRPVEHPNAGNTAIYDVDPDDPYEIDDGSFMDMRPGGQLTPFARRLTPGTLATAEGERQVRYIKGRGGETLGYLSEEGGTIGEITLTSTDVVTKNGIRVGNSYGELTERMGAFAEAARVEDKYTEFSKEGLTYRLEGQAAGGSATDIPPSARIVAIILR